MTISVADCGDLGLPIGRWPATLDELKTFAELDDVAHRREVLTEWQQLTDALRDAVGEVAAAWLAGSFFTRKANPSDLDCVYVVRRELIEEARKDGDRARFLQAIQGDGAKRYFNLRVDAYILHWWPRPGTHRGSDARRREYLETRGYWDDLWSRHDDRDPALAKLPRRGYLEVILDGYH